MLISVVIPCYNEVKVIADTLLRIGNVIDGIGGDGEIVLVDDGSTDGTWEKLLELRKASSHQMVLLRLSRNFGQQMAITAGLEHAAGDYVLLIDADLQDPPELLPEMLALARGGCDIVYGVRRSRAGEGIVKKATAFLFYRLMKLLSKTSIPPDAGDFRLLSRKALDSLLAMPEKHRYLRGMVSWLGFRQCPLEYDRGPRMAGETKYTLWKMISFSLDAIFSFSAFPLRIATIVGCIFSVGSMLFFLYVYYLWSTNNVVPGWSSLIASVIFIGGVQLIILGIAGEYIGKIFEEIKGRPLYIISDIVKDNNKSG